MEFSDYAIYVDESGDHALTHANSPYPIFCLAFCIFKKSDYVADVVPKLQGLRFRRFGHDAFVLHKREVRKRENPFEMLRAKQLDFLKNRVKITNSPTLLLNAEGKLRTVHWNWYFAEFVMVKI